MSFTTRNKKIIYSSAIYFPIIRLYLQSYIYETITTESNHFLQLYLIDRIPAMKVKAHEDKGKGIRQSSGSQWPVSPQSYLWVIFILFEVVSSKLTGTG